MHRSEPPNLFKREKIPYRTILVAFMFLILGSFFLIWGAIEFMNTGFMDAYEKWILGSLLFIPGSYHSVLAVQALRGVPGWDY